MLDIAKQVNFLTEIAHARWHLGNLARCQGRYDESNDFLTQCLSMRLSETTQKPHPKRSAR